jgi:Mrp family chromosome partitioning ATPase
MTKDLRGKAATRIQQRLRTDLNRTADVEGRLNAQLAQMTATAASATPKLQRANDLAADIVRLQTRNGSVDEQLHNLMIEDSAPGAAHLSAIAVVPLYPTTSGILRQALIMILAGIFLGLLAAVAAHKLDPKVYIATDVERVLGFAPMAVLPDFAEVSDRVVEEHMLRLAAGIEYARQQGNLRSCIFTGTGPGTGVTTVVTRVREMLEAMGRATVLVDASGTPLPPPPVNSGGLGLQDSSSQLATRPGSRSTALLQQLADETETGEESLVLTDTAPLTVSAETEYLARLVDCAIIVIESGVTTRAQLREVAHSLQRVDVAAVGFVLNRVSLKKADPAFRRSVRGIERHLRDQGRSFKEELEEIQKQKKLQSPDAYLFYVSEWRAANPKGDVDAAIAEAKRLGYEVVEQ